MLRVSLQVCVLTTLLPLLLPTAAAQAPVQPVSAPIHSPPLASEELIIAVENPPVVMIADIATGKVKATLSLSSWQPSGAGRPIAVDNEGHLFVEDVATNTISMFDRMNRFVRQFAVNLSCAGNPSGAGLRDMAVTKRGTIIVLGGWNNGTINYLLEIDPETGDTFRCCDLNAVVGWTFEGARLALDANGSAYITQYSPLGGPKSIAKINMATCSLEALIATPAANTTLVDIDVLPSGALLVGDTWNGNVWMSDPLQSTWCPLGACSVVPSSHQTFGFGHGFLYANGNASCGASSPGVDVIPLECGATVVEHFDFTFAAIEGIVVRHD